MEANIKSGSLITARFALEQNREIFAVPGFPLDQRHSGTNKLINDGAYLFESSQDVINILEEFQPELKKQEDIPITPEHHDETQTVQDVSYIKAEILNKLSTTPISFDNLARILNFPRKILHLALVELELEENIQRIGLDNFIIIL